MPGAGDCIAAAASPPGRSSRALIRLSGADLTPIAHRFLDGPPPPRVPTACRFRLGGAAPLPVLATRFAAPNSYTGEDVLEIQMPGQPALIERVLHALTGAGDVRLAEPGEFTRRAYLNGRIDLSAAEGIAATIAAVSDAQLHAAGLLRRGRLGRWSASVVDRLGQLLALVEAGIDFVDQDDVVPIAPADLHRGLRDLEREVKGLLARSRSWDRLEALPSVVLVGAPNVGKSTLFNALLGRDRAVTSDAAGTTRDVLAEPLRLTVDGEAAEVMLVDLAGLDLASGMLDERMQAAAHDAVARADLIVHLFDAPGPTDPVDRVVREARTSRRTPVLRVRTKADRPGESGYQADLAVSGATGQGLDQLRRLIARRLGDRAVHLAAETLALQHRHEAALRRAQAAIERAMAWLEPQRASTAVDHAELIAGAMREALDQLGQLGGALSPDEVIGKVFATFCVGK